jgi:hypothetical protein
MKNAVFWDVVLCRSCVNRHSSETSVQTRSTWRHNPEDGILHTCSYFPPFTPWSPKWSFPFIFSEYNSVCIPYSFQSIFCCLGRFKESAPVTLMLNCLQWGVLSFWPIKSWRPQLFAYLESLSFITEDRLDHPKLEDAPRRVLRMEFVVGWLGMLGRFCHLMI